MSEEVSRRKYIAIAGGVIAVAAIGGAAWYLSQPPAPTPVPTPTPTPTPTATPTPTPTPTPVEKVNLTAWYLTDPKRTEFYESSAAKFSEIDPEANVKFEFIGRYADYTTKVSAAFATGTEADIIYMWFGEVWTNHYASGGVLRPLPIDEYGIEEKLVPGILNLSTFEGEVYMVPVNLGAAFLYYNESMVSDVGYEWEDFQQMNIEEFSAVCEKLQAKGYTPIVHSHEVMNSTIIPLSGLMGGSVGPDSYRKVVQGWRPGITDYEKWSQPGVVKVFEYLYDWLDKGYFIPGINAIDATGAEKAWQTEKACFWWAYISRVVSTYGAAPDLEFGTSPSPVIDPNQSSKIQIHCTGFTITKKCEYPEAAMRFIDFMTDDEQGLSATKYGLLTPVKSAFKEENYGDYMPHYRAPMNKYAEGPTGTVWRGDYLMSPEVNAEVHKVLARFFDMALSPTDITNELDGVFETFRTG